MGFEVYNEALSDYLKPTEKEKNVMFSRPEAELLEIFGGIESMGGVDKYREIISENIRGLEDFVGVIPGVELEASKANYEKILSFVI